MAKQNFTREQGKLISDLAGLVSLGKERKDKDTLKEEMRDEFKEEFNKKFEALEKSGLQFESDDDGFKYMDVDDEPEPVNDIQKMVNTPPERQEKTKLAKQIHKANDRALIWSAVKKVHPAQTRFYKEMVDGTSKLSKALADATGAGAEWRPTVMSADFIEQAWAKSKLSSYFYHETIPDNVGTISRPGGEANISWYRRTATSEDDIAATIASTPDTSSVEWNPEELSARVPYEQKMLEDSPVNFTDWIRRNLIKSAGLQVDWVTMNGDTDTDNPIDSDINNSADPRTCWKGVRTLTDSSHRIDIGDVISVTTFREVWKELAPTEGFYDYSDTDSLVLALHRLGWLRFLVIAEVLTKEQYGQGATILSGQLENIFQIPLEVTPVVRATLNASGTYDGSTTNYTIGQFINHRSFAYGDKRKVTVESDKNILTGRFDVVGTLRMDFQPLYDTSTEPITATMYGIDTTT